MSDEPRDPNLETVLATLHDAVLESMYGAMPGVVVSYDATKRMASIQPSLERAYLDEDGNRVSKPQPIINDVPVVMFGTNALRIKLTLVKGDPVLLLWCGQSLAAWKKRGYPTADINDQRHNYNDVVAIPGCVDFAHASEHAAMIEFTDTVVKIGGDEPLVRKSEFDGHTHGGGTLSNSSGTVTGTSGGASSVTGTAKLRA